MNAPSSPDSIQCLSDGWRLYLKEPAILTVATLIIGVVNALFSLIPFANLLVGPPLLGSLYLMIVAIDRGNPVTLGNLADGFRFFLPLVIASVLVSIIVIVGMIALIIPGIYFALAYSFTSLFIVDKGLDFWPAMEASRRTITRVIFSYLILAIVMLLILLVGSIPFGLGLLVAAPVCMAAQYSYYKALQGDDEVIGTV